MISTPSSPPPPVANSTSLMLFQHQIELGLPLEEVQEILNPTQTPITPLPNTLGAVRGLLNLRGQLVLVLDLGYLLTQTYTPGLHPNRVIRLRPQGTVLSDSRPPDQLGLLVERVHYVVSVSPDRFDPVPNLDPVPASWRPRLSPLVAATAHWQERSWQILSVSALITPSLWT